MTIMIRPLRGYMSYISKNRNIYQLNKLSKLHNGKNIFFCKTDYLEQIFDLLMFHRIPSILISGNSDLPITDELALKVPSCIYKWFSQSVITDNPIMAAIPYGIDNGEPCEVEGHGFVWEHAKEKIEILSNPPFRKPSKKIYANFSESTNPVRKKVSRLCRTLPDITDRISYNHLEANNKPYSEYVRDILDHEMVVCPRGNAPAETHRFWEALYLNRVPIIKTNKGNSPFHELPVIVLKDWKQLQDSTFLYEEYERVKSNPTRMLDLSYWEELILSSVP